MDLGLLDITSLLCTTEQWSAPYEFDPTISIGDATLATYGVQTGYWWVWLGIGVLAGYAILFNVITTLALTFLSCESSWLCCAVLCCAVLCCAVLCCAVLCCCESHEGSLRNQVELMLFPQLLSGDSPDES